MAERKVRDEKEYKYACLSIFSPLSTASYILGLHAPVCKRLFYKVVR
jgi:hypothetical protein